jgi:hypothetical protein
MSADVKTAQATEDSRTQTRLTRSVGTRLERPVKSTTSPWSAVKRLLRVG